MDIYNVYYKKSISKTIACKYTVLNSSFFVAYKKISIIKLFCAKIKIITFEYFELSFSFLKTLVFFNVIIMNI